MMQDNRIQAAVQEEVLARLVVGLKSSYAELEAERSNLVKSMEGATGERHQAIEERLATNHIRMARLQEHINSAEAQLANLRGVGEQQLTQLLAPPPPPPSAPAFPEALIAVPVLFILCVGLPLSIAYARRIWRRTGDAGSSIPREVLNRLERIDQNVDAIAVEVERIGETQRYLAKQQAEHLALARESDPLRR